jgi:oligopeptide/dipeptide ABC transporter ATP-binding protein
MTKKHALLEVRDLVVEFHTEEGIVRAVDGLSFTLNKGETLGIVGESGCGKSVTALSIMRLIAKPAGKIVSGQILFDGQDLLTIPEEAMRRLRGNRISMIFQEPMTSLNPVFTVGDQIMEVLRIHQGLSKKEGLIKSIEMLTLVGIASPKERVHNYPHQLSGGMRQRVMIAMALACKPDLLIADEPTTALDVTIQAQIMELMQRLQQELNMAIVLITHDLGVVAESCQRVSVMYAGQVVEEASVLDLFSSPRHPYTLGLLNSIPGYARAAMLVGEDGRPRLSTIPGMVPNLLALSTGCRFYDRCFQRKDLCQKHEIELSDLNDSRTYRCLFPLGEKHKGNGALKHDTGMSLAKKIVGGSL